MAEFISQEDVVEAFNNITSSATDPELGSEPRSLNNSTSSVSFEVPVAKKRGRPKKTNSKTLGDSTGDATAPPAKPKIQFIEPTSYNLVTDDKAQRDVPRPISQIVSEMKVKQDVEDLQAKEKKEIIDEYNAIWNNPTVGPKLKVPRAKLSVHQNIIDLQMHRDTLKDHAQSVLKQENSSASKDNGVTALKDMLLIGCYFAQRAAVDTGNTSFSHLHAVADEYFKGPQGAQIDNTLLRLKLKYPWLGAIDMTNYPELELAITIANIVKTTYEINNDKKAAELFFAKKKERDIALQHQMENKYTGL